MFHNISICSGRDFPLASICCLIIFGTMLHLVWCRTNDHIELCLSQESERKKNLFVSEKITFQSAPLKHFCFEVKLKNIWIQLLCYFFCLLLSVNDFWCLIQLSHSNLKCFLLTFLVTFDEFIGLPCFCLYFCNNQNNGRESLFC